MKAGVISAAAEKRLSKVSAYAEAAGYAANIAVNLHRCAGRLVVGAAASLGFSVGGVMGGGAAVHDVGRSLTNTHILHFRTDATQDTRDAAAGAGAAVAAAAAEQGG
jgi:hypothetical protein